VLVFSFRRSWHRLADLTLVGRLRNGRDSTKTFLRGVCVMTVTLNDVRSNALFVRVAHYRWVGEGKHRILLSAADIRANGLTHFMGAKGGATRLQVVYKDGRIVNVKANCHDNDAFCKKTGIQYCLDRL
jgi:hypothetical protein